jgi:hypothetical protein
MFDLNSFDFEERHFPYWPNQLYRIIDNKSAAKFKAALDIRFEVGGDPDDGACKHILEDHFVRPGRSVMVKEDVLQSI